MSDWACNACGFLWASFGEFLSCPECESNEIEKDEELEHETFSEG